MTTSPRSLAYGPWEQRVGSDLLATEPLLVSGIGGIVYGSGSEEPRFQVRLTAFRDGRLPSSFNALEPALDPARYSWQVVPVGLFPRFQVGDVVLQGQVVESPRYVEESFDVDVEGGTRVVFHADRGKVGPNPFAVIPPRPTALGWPASPSGSVRPGARYLKCSTADPNVHLLIPCAEIVRTYYASSTGLARAFFSEYARSRSQYGTNGAPRHLDELYDPDTSALADGIARLSLKLRAGQTQGLNVARLAFCPFARTKALEAAALLQRLHQQNTVPMIVAWPPFRGLSTWSVRGVWTGPDRRWFLVFSLDRCTAPWPFRRLDLLQTVAPEAGSGDPDAHELAAPRPPYSRAPGGERIDPDGVPTLLAGLVREQLPRVRFEPPGGLEVAGRELEGAVGGVRRRVAVDPAPTVVSTGEPTSSLTDVAPLATERPGEADRVPEVPRLRPDLAIFVRAVECVSEEDGYALRWRQPSAFDVAGDGVYLPLVPRIKPSASCFVDAARAERRAVMIAELRRGVEYAYLCEIEPRLDRPSSTLLIWRDDRAEIEDAGLIQLVNRAADALRTGHGPWSSDLGLSGVRQEQLTHAHAPREDKASATAEFARRMCHQFLRKLAAAAGPNE